MATGVVKWFNPNKSFGFIKPDDGGSDVFVHISALQAAGLHTLDDNQKIQYDLENSKGKTSAVNLKLLQSKETFTWVCAYEVAAVGGFFKRTSE